MAGGSRANARAAVIAALAAGLTIRETAQQTGVSEGTIYRWRRKPDFTKAVESARSELISNTVGRLSDSATAAVAVLRRLLSEDTPPSVRLGAARAILEMASRYRESEELERRLTVLEEAVATKEVRR